MHIDYIPTKILAAMGCFIFQLNATGYKEILLSRDVANFICF